LKKSDSGFNKNNQSFAGLPSKGQGLGRPSGPALHDPGKETPAEDKNIQPVRHIKTEAALILSLRD